MPRIPSWIRCTPGCAPTGRRRLRLPVNSLSTPSSGSGDCSGSVRWASSVMSMMRPSTPRSNGSRRN
ncbi:gallidermin family lantibiotic [Corynebacterium pygosceleis]|uniref:gallidermin family lantibiotic n=1 Tax=Corynebacterium pygosceleis TaxID=2800406 RepID=UPI00396A83A1